MSQKLLVPIDFSEFNKRVISKAIEYAKLVDGELYLLHVATLDLGVIVSETGFTYLPELQETALNTEAAEMHLLKKAVEQRGVRCHTFIKQGIPADIIIDTAKEIKADMIIIGSLGHTKLYKVFIGSVASDVIKFSPVPLLVIPKKLKK